MGVQPGLVLLSQFRIIDIEYILTFFSGIVHENALELVDESDRVNVRPQLESIPDSRLTLRQALIGGFTVSDHAETLSYLLLQLGLKLAVFIFVLFGFFGKMLVVF